jgi:hypothetical protein
MEFFDESNMKNDDLTLVNISTLSLTYVVKFDPGSVPMYM